MLGVIGLRLGPRIKRSAPTIHQSNLLDALSRQIALALDRPALERAFRQHARVVAESERLGKALLDSMSHEIRTPLAAINAAVSDLGEVESLGRRRDGN